MRLENQHAIVVGASSGMGRAVAALVHGQGAHVVAVARGQQRLEESVDSFAKNRSRITVVAADMTRAKDRRCIFASLEKVDHLVVTAADLVYLTIEKFTEEAMDTILRSKIAAPFFLAQQAAKKMPHTGSITFVSGVAAERPLPNGVLTGTVNGALNAMVRGLAIALGPIRVNTVSPGWVDTPLWRNITDDTGKRAAFKSMAAKIPVRRIGKTSDVAEAILAVMTNGFISGSTLYVDGGQRLI